MSLGGASPLSPTNSEIHMQRDPKRMHACKHHVHHDTAALSMNEEMGGDGVALGVISFGFAAMTFYVWIVNLRLAWRLRAAECLRGLLLNVPPASLVFVWVVLVLWADAEVRQNSSYIWVLMFLATAWLAGANRCFALIGLSMRDDGIERNNTAAALAWAGANIGVTFCYAGANIGAGPSLWNNVFSAALATLTLLLIWLALELCCHIASSITIERDRASGIRGGGLLAAAGLILGRAVAGDWHSIVGTVADFARDGWPVLVLAFVALVLERALRPTARRISPPLVTHGIVPAAGYLLLATGWLVHLGFWEGRK